MKIKSLLLTLIIALSSFGTISAQDGAYIGEIKLFAGNFAPRGWMKCEGQLLPIAQYSPLFALIGTYYGGDGKTNFALPDLRGRVVAGAGQGAGLSNYSIGEKVGTETVTLNASNIPPHNHMVVIAQPVSSKEGTLIDPTGGILAVPGTNAYAEASKATSTLATEIITTTNRTQQAAPITNMQPTLSLTYIICVEGIFPSHQ